MDTNFHIIESEGKFLVLEAFTYKGHFLSKTHEPRFNSLDKAEDYVRLQEDALPASSVSGGNVCGTPDMGFTPLLFKLLRRRKRRRSNGVT